MSGTWRATVRKIQDDVDAVDANSTNRPLDDLEARTDYLKGVVDRITSGSKLVMTGEGLASDVEEGNLVHYSSATGRYEKALAKWAGEFGANGELVAAESARVAGLVESKTSTTVGDLILAGMVELSDSALVNLFGTATPTPGIYFLSGTDAGRCVGSEPSTPLAVVQYVGSNNVVLLKDVEPNHSHIHKNYDITGGNWLNVSDAQFDTYEVPAGAELGYDRASDSSMDDLFATYVTDAVVVSNGRVRDSSEFVVNQDNVWKMTPGIPTAGIQIYSTAPLSFGQSIVRAVRTDTSETLTLRSENGVVTVDAAAWAEDSDSPENNPYAVSSLSGRTFKRTPVVTNVLGGSGVDVSLNSSGIALVSLSELTDELKRPVSVDFNNAMHVTDGDMALMSFPENRESSIIGAIPIGGLSTGATHKAKAFVEQAGLLGGGTWPAVSVAMTFVPGAGSGVVDVGASTTTQAATVASFSSTQGEKYYKEAGDDLSVTAHGILYLRLTVASSAKNKNIYGFGVRIIPQVS